MNWPDDFWTSLSTSAFEGQEGGKCVWEGCRSLISWNLDCKNVQILLSGWYLSSRTNWAVNELKSFPLNASQMCCSGQLVMMKENGMEWLLTEFISNLRMYFWDSGSPLVFESPVQSGFLTPQGLNQDRNQSTLFPEVKKTGPDHKKTTDHGFNQSLDRSWSALVLTGLRPVLQQIFYNYESVTLLTLFLPSKWAQER